jgi:arsenite methyltransferase
MLGESRLAPHFEFFGDFSRHCGAFKGCGNDLPFSVAGAGQAAAAGCCR